MSFSRGLILAAMAVCAGVIQGQTLTLVSGHGQVIQEQFMASRPFTVRAVDATGRPIPGVPVTWTLSPASAGSLISPSAQTNEQGEASSGLFASNNMPGQSFVAATLTASSPHGVVPFAFVVSLSRGAGGGLVPLPFVQPHSPTQGSTIEGASGTTLPGAVRIQVVAQGGVDLGRPVPNVGLRVEPLDETAGGPSAHCNAPAGIVITDQSGFATCDLVVTGPAGLVQMRGVVGEYWPNLRFDLRVTSGPSCTFGVSPLTAGAVIGGGTGTVSVTAAQGCQWTAISAVPWITVVNGASGLGNGTVTYSVAPNSGPQRAGAITIAGQQVTITQAAAGSAGPAPLAFATAPGLPGATTNLSYSIGLGVTGGTAPYRWSAGAALPLGLALNATNGILSGIPTMAGAYSIPVTVTDATNSSVTQTFALTVSQVSVGSPTLIFTTSSFPPATVGVAYQQPVGTAGGCSNPFSGGPNITLASGALPPGLTLQQLVSGVGIAGTPTLTGSYSFALRATSCENSTVRQFAITVSPSATAAPMTASVSELSFVANVGGVTRPADQAIAITTGTGSMSFGASTSTQSGGNWLAVSPGTGQTPSNLSVGIGDISALLPGVYRGEVTILSQASNSPLRVPVMLTIVAAATVNVAPDAVRFDHAAGVLTSEQTISVTSAFANPEATPFNVAVRTGASWLTVAPTSGVTTANIRLIVNSAGLQPGNYTATVDIAPVGSPAGGKTVRVTLTVAAPLVPTPLMTAVTNAASFASGAIAPGEIITVFGTNLTTTAPVSLRLTPGGMIDNVLDETRMLVNGSPAPLIYASSTQISAVAPYSLAARTTARIEVEHRGVRSAAMEVGVVQAAPGIFRLNATTQGAIVNQNGTINGVQDPARSGTVVSIYATGEGLLSPAPFEGAVASVDNLPVPVLPVAVEIGGINAEVLYAGPAPGQLFGLIQVNARVPATTVTGDAVPVILTVGATRSPAATMVVR